MCVCVSVCVLFISMFWLRMVRLVAMHDLCNSYAAVEWIVQRLHTSQAPDVCKPLLEMLRPWDDYVGAWKVSSRESNSRRTELGHINVRVTALQVMT